MNAFRTALLPLAAALSLPVVAAETAPVKDNGFSYNHAEGLFYTQDWDGRFDVDGFGGRISVALDEHFFGRGELLLFDGDTEDFLLGVDVDGWQIGVGGGFHTPAGDKADLVLTADLLLVNYDVDASRFSLGDDEDDIGVRLAGGARMQAGEKLELEGGLFLESVDESELGVYGGARVNLTQQLDLGAGVRLGGDLTELTLSARYNF